MAETNEQSGGELLVAALAAHGVDTVFGIPGTHNLEVFAAMPKYGVRNITTRHEQGAGYAADGYARSTGKLGVVVTTTGPAALNAAAALGQAYSDSVPVLLIAPGMPTGHPSHGNGLLHELRDQRGSLAGVVAESHRVESLEEIPFAVAQAVARMRTGRPRSEYLEIPLNLLDEHATVTAVAPVTLPARPLPHQDDISTAAAALGAAQRTVIIVGGGAGDAVSEVRLIAEQLGAAVVSTTNGKGVLREDHALSLGTGVHQPSFEGLISQADAVLAIGTEFAPSDWWLGIPKLPETVVRIDIDPSAVIANLAPSHALVGDAAATLQALSAEIPDSENDTDWVAEAQAALAADHAELGSYWVDAMRAIDSVLPEGTVVAADNAMAAYYGALGSLTLKRSKSFLFPTGVGTLGFGLPAGIGAKLADPEAPVLVIQGDGGIMFTIQELATAADCGLSLPILVFDNGGYGEIHNEMVDRDDPVHSVALGSTDFVALAKALGCEGVSVTNVADLGDEVTAAFNRDKPTLIHVPEESRATEGLKPRS